MELVTLLHLRLAYSAIFFMFIMGLWGLWNYFRRKPVTSGYLGALAIGEMLIIAQSLAGILLYLTGARAAGLIHYLYGMTAVISIPAAFAYVRGQESRRENLVYALVCLFVFVLAIRGIITAAVGR